MVLGIRPNTKFVYSLDAAPSGAAFTINWERSYIAIIALNIL